MGLLLRRHEERNRHGAAAVKSDLIDIAAEKKAESAKAFLIFDGKVTAWVPKSQVEEDPGVDESKKTFTYTMPEWLAKDKGFI